MFILPKQLSLWLRVISPVYGIGYVGKTQICEFSQVQVTQMRLTPASPSVCHTAGEDNVHTYIPNSFSDRHHPFQWVEKWQFLYPMKRVTVVSGL